MDGWVFFLADRAADGTSTERVDIESAAIASTEARAGRATLLKPDDALKLACNPVYRAAARVRGTQSPIEQVWPFLQITKARPGLDRRAAATEPTVTWPQPSRAWTP